MRHVVIAIFPEVQALDVSGPLDVFSEANAFLDPAAHYTLTLASPDGATVRSSNGMRIVADASLVEATGPYDVALVAGGPALPTQPIDAALVEWLQAVAAQSPCFGSICTGAFALGAAGLLDGRLVTTHWQSSRALAHKFPLARVDHDRIHARDGALVTSAGVTAGIDLALALLAEHHGPVLALAVAKRLVVFTQRQGGQSQFSPFLVASPQEAASPMGRITAHVMAHLAADLSVRSLARVAGMSERNFARMFVQWTDVTPHEFVERARVDVARNLLEVTVTPVKTIAYDCGFTSADRMRRVFASRFGVTPGQYRDSFRVAAPNPHGTN
jgi:transcriptional regulator GlxA family with amidase domain